MADLPVRRRVAPALVLLLGALLAPLVAPPAATPFPERPITLIIPWAPGGSTDQTARVLAKAAEAHLGQPIVVVNKPGAATTLGMAELANAKPDGHTIGTLSSSTYLVALRGRPVPYDPLKSFSWIAYYGDNLIGIVVRADSPWKSLKDLAEDGKARPGAIKYGTSGVGSPQHLTTEAWATSTGAKLALVPQKGASDSVAALLGGHVDFITEVSVWAPQVEAKTLRLLAVTSQRRGEGFAEAPTMAELGHESAQSVAAIIGPAGLPEPVRAKLESAFRKAHADPTFRETMRKLHMVAVDLPGAEVEKIVRKEMDRARTLIERLGLNK